MTQKFNPKNHYPYDIALHNILTACISFFYVSTKISTHRISTHVVILIITYHNNYSIKFEWLMNLTNNSCPFFINTLCFNYCVLTKLLVLNRKHFFHFLYRQMCCLNNLSIF